MHTIDILTGPIQSGKTTHLISWLKFNNNCAGILSPLTGNKRQFYSIHNEVFHPFEAPENIKADDELITIGKYRFLNSAFVWARSQLEQAVELKPHWLIIDEIGPIELRGEGLEPQVRKIIDEYPRSRKNRLILVIRDQLLEEAIEHYNLGDDTQIHESFLEII